MIILHTRLAPYNGRGIYAMGERPVIRLAIIRCNQYFINIDALTHLTLRIRISVMFYRRVTPIILTDRDNKTDIYSTVNIRDLISYA